MNDKLITKPPEIFIPTDITNEKTLIKNYEKALLKINEWEYWFKINITNRR